MKFNRVLLGDCVKELPKLPPDVVDLVYFDPPFFTQKVHALRSREDCKKYAFEDKYDSLESYLSMMEQVLHESRRILKDTGSLFLHCDRTASHYIRVLMDKVFGGKNFQSEIIWAYKRWSNAKKGLLNAHQVIYFYSKSSRFKFHTLYTDYSETTNLDQILQERKRDENGTSVYRRDENGNVIIGKEKKGVPLTDVWEIPYLNPKAKERTGYPTQKPVALLNQILRIATDEGDMVLDPFCGSGTTCVSAKLLGRKYLGMDSSLDAVNLAKKRLENMVISVSRLLKTGRENYQEKTPEDLALLTMLDAFPVQRNSGIDGFLKTYFEKKPVPIKIQQEQESLEEAIEKLEHATQGKGYKMKIVIQTNEMENNRLFPIETDVMILQSPKFQLTQLKNTSIC